LPCGPKKQGKEEKKKKLSRGGESQYLNAWGGKSKENEWTPERHDVLGNDNRDAAPKKEKEGGEGTHVTANRGGEGSEDINQQMVWGRHVWKRREISGA